MELAGGGDKENAGGGTAADAARQQLLARLLGSGVLNSVKVGAGLVGTPRAHPPCATAPAC